MLWSKMLFMVLFSRKGEYHFKQRAVAGPALLLIWERVKLCQGKKTLPVPTKSNMQKSFLLFIGSLCPTHVFTHQMMAHAAATCQSPSLLSPSLLGRAQPQHTAPGHLLSSSCAWRSLGRSRSTPHSSAEHLPTCCCLQGTNECV